MRINPVDRNAGMVVDLSTALALVSIFVLVVIAPRVATADNDLLVSSAQSDQVLRYDGETGAFVGVFASGSGLDNPNGLAYGPDGNLYVASRGSGEILRFDGLSGAFINVFASADGLTSPSGIEFGPDGHLYVSDFGTNVVHRLHGATGAPLGTIGNDGELDSPQGLTFGPDGDLYVASQSSHEVVRYFGVSGNFIGVFASSDSPIRDVEFGADGDLYTSGLAAQVERHDGTTGAALGFFTSGGAVGVGIGLLFGPDGDLYVASQVGDNVSRFDGENGTFINVFASGLSTPTWLVFMPTTASVTAVVIDIRPATSSNILNPFRPGVTPVAILGSLDLDVFDIDPESLAFGPAGAPNAHAHGPHYRDVNGDLHTDLVGHFRTQDTGIALGDREACLSGERAGVPFAACDAIRTVPGACGLGSELALVLLMLRVWRRRQRLGPELAT